MPSRRSKPSSSTRSSDRSGDLDPDVGLCSCCRWSRVQKTARGGRFWRCGRAEDDERFVRYPRLPIVECIGFEEPDDQ